MTDFIKRHKAMTVIMSTTFIVVLILIFTGQSICNFTIEQLSQIKCRNKAVCTVNPENATQIIYKGRTYQILNQAVDNSAIGGWSGVFRKIVILDDHFRILKQIKSEVDSTSQVKDVEKDLPNGSKYVVTYFNVFTIKGVHQNQAIAVSLDRGTFKAVSAETESKDEAPIRFDKVSGLD